MSFNDRIQQLRAEDVEHTKRRICYWGCSQDWANVPDFIAAIRRGKPRMFLMEQVEGFLTFDNGRYMQKTVAALEELLLANAKDSALDDVLGQFADYEAMESAT